MRIHAQPRPRYPFSICGSGVPWASVVVVPLEPPWPCWPLSHCSRDARKITDPPLILKWPPPILNINKLRPESWLLLCNPHYSSFQYWHLGFPVTPLSPHFPLPLTLPSPSAPSFFLNFFCTLIIFYTLPENTILLMATGNPGFNEKGKNIIIKKVR